MRFSIDDYFADLNAISVQTGSRPTRAEMHWSLRDAFLVREERRFQVPEHNAHGAVQIMGCQVFEGPIPRDTVRYFRGDGRLVAYRREKYLTFNNPPESGCEFTNAHDR